MNYRTVLVLVLLLTLFGASLGIGVGVYYLLSVFISPPPSQTSTVACVNDTFTCPDGSVVGRVRPACTFAACPVTASATSPIGTVTGKVTISPICPVEPYPPSDNCKPRGYKTELKITVLNGAASKSIETDASGSFETDLFPGTYTVTAVISGLYPRCESKQVNVVAGGTSTVLLSCDSGIR